MNGPKAELYAHDLSAATWRKSSHSGGEGNCVEITDLPGGGLAVRDSKDTRLHPLRFTAEAWDAFRVGVLSRDLYAVRRSPSALQPALTQIGSRATTKPARSVLRTVQAAGRPGSQAHRLRPPHA
ncbi:DUF397 domain-containing protein [Streptomyces gamaensis]|uniref:DUF397 domain-containing protein n=1 Tax=Streptomyces gamaensis TaxID=1763542 RepID=A0ABW0Z5M2_9ACTN